MQTFCLWDTYRPAQLCLAKDCNDYNTYTPFISVTWHNRLYMNIVIILVFNCYSSRSIGPQQHRQRTRFRAAPFSCAQVVPTSFASLDSIVLFQVCFDLPTLLSSSPECSSRVQYYHAISYCPFLWFLIAFKMRPPNIANITMPWMNLSQKHCFRYVRISFCCSFFFFLVASKIGDICFYGRLHWK